MEQKAAIQEIMDQLDRGTATLQVFPYVQINNTSGLRFRPTSKANVESHQRFMNAGLQLVEVLEPFHVCGIHCQPNCKKSMYFFDVSHEPGLTSAKEVQEQHALKLAKHNSIGQQIDKVLDAEVEQQLTSLGVSVVRPETPTLPDFSNSWFQGTTSKGSLLWDTLKAKQLV